MEKRFEKFRQNTQENKIVYLEKYKRKKAFEATYNGEKNRGFGKIHTKKMHSGQNTMAKNYIWGKMQWRKRRGFGTYENIREKKAFEVTYNGEKSRGFGKK